MSASPWRQERVTIQCCRYCKPPKRYPGCGADCKEYKEEKAKYKADKQREKELLGNRPIIKEFDFNKVSSKINRKR